MLTLSHHYHHSDKFTLVKIKRCTCFQTRMIRSFFDKQNFPSVNRLNQIHAFDYAAKSRGGKEMRSNERYLLLFQLLSFFFSLVLSIPNSWPVIVDHLFTWRKQLIRHHVFIWCSDWWDVSLLTNHCASKSSSLNTVIVCGFQLVILIRIKTWKEKLIDK